MEVRTTVSFDDKEIRDLLIEKAKNKLEGHKNLGSSTIEIKVVGEENQGNATIAAQVHFNGIAR